MSSLIRPTTDGVLQVATIASLNKTSRKRRGTILHSNPIGLVFPCSWHSGTRTSQQSHRSTNFHETYDTSTGGTYGSILGLMLFLLMSAPRSIRSHSKPFILLNLAGLVILHCTGYALIQTLAEGCGLFVYLFT